jgi:WD40 repeat protein
VFEFRPDEQLPKAQSMSQPLDSCPSPEQRLEQILETYYRAVEAGQVIDGEDLIRQHPDLADELRSFLADKKLFEQAAGPLALPHPPAPADPNAVTLGPDPHGEGGPSSSLGRVRYVGDYELLAEIGRGGMGVIFRARQASLNRTVAVKMILAGQLPSELDLQRFRLEAEAAASLDHPNILPLYEVGIHEGQPYFSMKLIEGGSLASEGTRPRADRKSGQQWAARLIASVARAVHHSHQRGILHRDLKPSNILLDGDRTPFVADFGLARRLVRPGDQIGEAALTQTGAVVGTPSYMAPEQAGGRKDLTTAVDVYSLGAILYELLTGQPPHRAANALETLMQVLHREPPAPRSLNRALPRDLETICLKCLHKEPAKRYESAAALADDLERWVRGEPILARRVRWPGRLGRWCRRNPVLAAVTAVAVVGVFAAIGFMRALYIQYENDSFRIWMRWAETSRRDGRFEDARKALREARASSGPAGPDWRGEAIQYAATPGLLPRRQVLIDEGTSYASNQIGLEWLDAGQVRVIKDGILHVWRASTGELVMEGRVGEPIPTPPEPLPPGAKVLGRSPDHGWSVLRLPRQDKQGEVVVLWDARQKRIAHTLPDVGPVPGYVVLAQDGRRMAYVDPLALGTVRLWDWELRRFTAVLPTGSGSQGNSGSFEVFAGFSPDGELLTTQGQVGEILIWQAETGRLLTRLGQIWGRCRWSPDGKWLATTGPWQLGFLGSSAKAGFHVHFWELRYPSRSYATADGAVGVTLSPSGKHLITGHDLWELVQRGDELALARVPGGLEANAMGAREGFLWGTRIEMDRETFRQTLHLKRSVPRPLERSLTLPETAAPRAAGKGEFYRVRLTLPASDGRHVLVVLERVAWHPGAKEPPALNIASGCRLEWWDVEEGRRLAVWNEQSEEHDLYEVTLVPGDRFAVTRSRDSIKVWNVDTGKVDQDLPIPKWLTGNGVLFTPDGQYLVCYSSGKLLDGKSIQRTNTVLDIHKVSTGERVQHLELRDWSTLNDVTPLAVHFDAGWLVAQRWGPREGAVQLELWDLKTGKLWAFWTPHDGAPFAASFSHDGRLLVTHRDGELRLWPLPLLQQGMEEVTRTKD